jgi:hypothetical protein
MTVGLSEQAKTFVVDKDLNVRSIVGCVPNVTCKQRKCVTYRILIKQLHVQVPEHNALSVCSTVRMPISNTHTETMQLWYRIIQQRHTVLWNEIHAQPEPLHVYSAARTITKMKQL